MEERVAIFCPSKQEADCLRKFEDQLKGATVIYSGIGKINTVISCLNLANNYTRFILTGFAGGYKGLKRGDIVYPFDIYEHDFECAGLDGQGQHVYNYWDKSGNMDADFYSGDRLINSKDIAEKSMADRIACDMESYAFARAMRERLKEFAIVKVISDECNTETPIDFISACTDLSDILFKAVLQNL